mgnify:CR=1 FL=1
MIKFFRKIRQNLLMENKTGKYFKYAIGEILLVVIGILIALQINTWNENRKLDEIKENYYRQIILDLESDKDYSESLISKFGVELKKYEDYKESFDVPGLNAYKTIINIGKLQIGGQAIDFKTNTIKTLASTGNMNLLPQNINNRLITYIANQNKMLEGNNKNANAMLEIITKAVMSGANQSLRERVLIHPELIKELKLEDNYPQIVLELEAYHLLKGVTSNTSINLLNELIEDADLTIDFIKKELKK